MDVNEVDPGQDGLIEQEFKAILRAVDVLEPGDALLICGKGHETGQIVGDTVLPFSDHQAALAALGAEVAA